MNGRLPLKIKVSYALGQFGWSILSGIIQVWLVWFYFPPEDVYIDELIPRGAILGIFSLIGLVTMAGRFMDAITDPWIANLSDNNKHKKGRRIPFMAKAAIPFTVLTCLVFLTPTPSVSALNIIWIVVMLLSYYVFYTMYVAPYFALTSELSHNENERLDLSTYIALTWFLGYIVASGASFIWPIFENMGYSFITSIRITIVILALFALIFLLIPVFMIDEKKYVKTTPNNLNTFDAFKLSLSNKNFLIFEIFFLAYGIAITIFQTGNVYYVSVLLGFKESAVLYITAATGFLAFALYPLVNILTKKFGKKILCQFAMVLLIIAYFYCSFLGMLPFTEVLQGAIFVFIAGIGFAIFGILPNAIVADLANNDGRKTGQNKEGMFYAVHTFMNKIGQMIAMLVFTSLLLLGKEPGNDLGIRLSGIVAAVIGVISLLIFLKYKEASDETI